MTAGALAFVTGAGDGVRLVVALERGEVLDADDVDSICLVLGVSPAGVDARWVHPDDVKWSAG